jgi:hypothetical protein
VASSCGGEDSGVEYAGPQTIPVNFVELDGNPGGRFRIEVRKLSLTERRWTVYAAVTNHTTATWWVTRPHFPGQTKFGLYASADADSRFIRAQFAAGRTTPPLLADRFSPPLPRHFTPGRRWTGAFSGYGRIPRERWVRFAFGRFQTNGDPPAGLPDGLMVVTDRAVRVS